MSIKANNATDILTAAIAYSLTSGKDFSPIFDTGISIHTTPDPSYNNDATVIQRLINGWFAHIPYPNDIGLANNPTSINRISLRIDKANKERERKW